MDVIDFNKFKEERAEGVIEETPTSNNVADVQSKLYEAADLNLEEVVIIGRGDGMLHYMHSEMTTPDIIYLLEKCKWFWLREEYEDAL